MIRLELISKPINWEWKKLGDCIEIFDHKRIPVKAEERRKRILNKNKSELYPYYGATGQVGWIDDYLFNEELVLLGEDGAPFFDSNKNKAYIVKGKFWVNNHVHVLRAIKTILSNSYLCFYLNIINYYGYVIGTTRLKLNQEHLKQIPILLPSLDEQQKIALILTDINKQIQYSNNVIKITKDLKKGMLQQLLTKGIGHTEFKETKLGRIPKEWEIKKIEEVVDVVRGASPRPAKDPRYFGGKIPWINVGDLTKDTSIYLNSVPNTLTYKGKEKSRYIQKNTLLLTNSGATLGVPKITKIEGCINDGIVAFLNLDPILKKYLYYFFFSITKKLRNIKQGIGQPNLNTQIVKDILFPLPNKKEQKQITDILEAVDYQIINEIKIKEKINFIKKGFMQALLTGKIRVKV